ncbi:uncharacterized protein LOC114038817 isoform X2 [Vombatus ursinus]|nr:uncharacterized protein LOC114038817 isoform X2 [Vombatus ursinus]
MAFRSGDHSLGKVAQVESEQRRPPGRERPVEAAGNGEDWGHRQEHPLQGFEGSLWTRAQLQPRAIRRALGLRPETPHLDSGCMTLGQSEEKWVDLTRRTMDANPGKFHTLRATPEWKGLPFEVGDRAAPTPSGCKSQMRRTLTTITRDDLGSLVSQKNFPALRLVGRWSCLLQQVQPGSPLTSAALPRPTNNTRLPASSASLPCSWDAGRARWLHPGDVGQGMSLGCMAAGSPWDCPPVDHESSPH